jgi:hypothetical protein
MLKFSDESLIIFFLGSGFGLMLSLIGNEYVTSYYRFIDSKPKCSSSLDSYEKEQAWKRNKLIMMLAFDVFTSFTIATVMGSSVAVFFLVFLIISCWIILIIFCNNIDIEV